ncbi:MAG: hypothetical protein AAB664_02745, partial [Patescibacteria group bacterium]
EIAPQKDLFDWTQLDHVMRVSEEQGVKLTLVIGRKVPRWPECYVPDWVQKLSVSEQRTETLLMMQAVVNRYKNSSALDRWQVENEPFFSFGVCQKFSKQELTDEINLVRRLDARPIQLTASGEMELWKTVAKQADILGISLYRKTWNRVFGYFTYPFPPEFYSLRAKLLEKLGKPIIVSELQAEPWFSESFKNKPHVYWYQTFTAEDFEEQIAFVKQTQLSEAYFWGVEWWAYMHEQNDDRLWNVAKEVFSKQ